MINKLFITNNVHKNIFAQMSLTKYPVNYFKENGWITKYFTDVTWFKNLEDYDVILIWSIQQVNKQRQLKKRCLLKLLKLQCNYKYKILDYLEDLHNINNFYDLNEKFYKEYFANGSKNYIILRNQTSINKYFPKCNCYTLPFSVDSNIIPLFNNDPKNKILLTGNINKSYLMRKRIHDLKDVHPIDVLDHPGYRTLKHLCIGKQYYNKINQYIASVATCGFPKYNYIVAKYFEIPATGALLFAFVDPIIDDLEQYGFKDMVNMLTFNDIDIEQKIQYILDPNNKEEIDKIRLAGYNLILERHTHDIRFKIEFDEFINQNIII